MNWIKTSDRLPEKAGVYIVTIVCDNGEFVRSEAEFTVNGFEDDIHDEDCIFDEAIGPMKFYKEFDMPTGYGDTETYYAQLNVIAWMPYPEPYNPNKD